MAATTKRRHKISNSQQSSGSRSSWMADPQDELILAQNSSNSHSGETESSSGRSLKSAPTFSDKGDSLSGRQGLKQGIEMAGLRTQLMLSQSDNKLLRQRVQEYAELTQQFSTQQSEFVREQEMLVRDVTVKFKQERGLMQATQDTMRARIMKLEMKLRKAEGSNRKKSMSTAEEESPKSL